MAIDEKNVIVSLKLKCDKCGSTSRYFTSESEEGSRKKATYVGWQLEGSGSKDLCPRCVDVNRKGLDA